MKVSISAEPIKGELEINGKEAEQFLSMMIPEFFKDGVGILNDIVKSWRWKNQVKILCMARSICEQTNVEPTVIPLKILVPILDKSSLEEDELLRLKWAQLLAYASSSKDFEYTKSFISILEQLTIIEAKILQWIHTEITLETEKVFSLEEISKEMDMSENKLIMVFDNFSRLGLCIQEQTGRGPNMNTWTIINTIRPNGKYRITSLGKEFLQACIQ